MPRCPTCEAGSLPTSHPKRTSSEVSARPSDSIALALRTGATIFASDEILDEAGVAIPDEQEDEVEKFREFLDTITPEDFGRAT